MSATIALYDEATVICVDTNVLIEIAALNNHDHYAEELLEALRDFGSRVVVTETVRREYHDKKVAAIERSRDAALRILNDATDVRIKSALGELVAEFKNYVASTLTPKVHRQYAEQEAEVAAFVAQHHIEPITETERTAWRSKAPSRYAAKTPPGWRDAPRTGDLEIYAEMIAIARQRQCDVIFVTEDSKEDWRAFGRFGVVIPTSALAEEFNRLSGQRLFLVHGVHVIDHLKRPIPIFEPLPWLAEPWRIVAAEVEKIRGLTRSGWLGQGLPEFDTFKNLLGVTPNPALEALSQRSSFWNVGTLAKESLSFKSGLANLAGFTDFAKFRETESAAAKLLAALDIRNDPAYKALSLSQFSPVFKMGAIPEVFAAVDRMKSFMPHVPAQLASAFNLSLPGGEQWRTHPGVLELGRNFGLGIDQQEAWRTIREAQSGIYRGVYSGLGLLANEILSNNGGWLSTTQALLRRCERKLGEAEMTSAERRSRKIARRTERRNRRRAVREIRRRSVLRDR